MKKMYEKPEMELLSFELNIFLMTEEDEDPSMGGSGYDNAPF